MTESTPALPVRYVHKQDWEGPPLAELADATIYNAARPLVGDRTWTGDFRRGIFYAAVRPGPYADGWARSNAQNDAGTVVFVDNADVERILEGKLKADGYRLADYHEIGMTTEEAARIHELPWHEPPRDESAAISPHESTAATAPDDQADREAGE